MSDRPLADADSIESVNESPPNGWRKESQLTAYVAVAIAVIAAGLAALAYFHPAHRGATGPAQQGGDAKVNVCSAYTTVRKAVVINTHLQAPDNNPIGELSVAANARLALLGGGVYLQQRLAANNAAPADLITAANSLADTMQQLGASYLAGATSADLETVRHDLDSELNQVGKACG